MSVDERSGWRDLEFSKHHRLWGHDCPMIDIDFLCCEYDQGNPRALIEYKHTNALAENYNQPNYKTLIRLGEIAQLPVFNVRYSADFKEYGVTPLNKYAVTHLPNPMAMNEKEYVTFLYKLRGRPLPEEVEDEINSSKIKLEDFM